MRSGIPLLLLTALFTALLALVIGATIAVGHSQPTPQAVQRLHLTDCELPCWADITPGSTSLTQVKRHVGALFPDFTSVSTDDAFMAWQRASSKAYILSINVTFVQGIVANIGIGTGFPTDEMPRLGELGAVFGTPTCVMEDERSGYASVLYESASAHAMLKVSLFSLSLSSPVHNMTFGDYDNFTCLRSLSSWRVFQNWHTRYF